MYIDKFLKFAADVLENKTNTEEEIQVYLFRLVSCLEDDAVKNNEEQWVVHTFFRDELKNKLRKIKNGEI